MANVPPGEKLFEKKHQQIQNLYSGGEHIKQNALIPSSWRPLFDDSPESNLLSNSMDLGRDRHLRPLGWPTHHPMVPYPLGY